MALGFKGGYRFPYSVAKELPITHTGVPSKLYFPVPVGFSTSVCRSDILTRDTVLATHEDGSVLIAGIAGSVAAVSDECIEVVPDTEQHMENAPIAEKLSEIPCQEIVEHIRRGGLMTESGFPMWRMLAPFVEKGEMLILNAVECEPGISCVHAMLHAYPDKILGGLKILMRALALPKAIAVMTESMHNEADILRRHLKHKGMLDILGAAEKFPLEHPAVLFSALTGARSAPSMQKIVIVTVMDCIAVYDLFVDGHASNCRIMTVEGKNYSVYLGTPIGEVATLCEVTAKEGTVPHLGGMVSAHKASEDDFVKADTKGVLFLDPYASVNSECIGCGKCSEYCPVGLLPMRIWENLQKRKEKALKLDACIACGVCTAVCSAKLDICESIQSYRKNGLPASASAVEQKLESNEEFAEYEEIGSIVEEEDGNEEEN